MKPKSCPYCGRPAQVIDAMTGPAHGCHPGVWCPRCGQAMMCQCRFWTGPAV